MNLYKSTLSKILLYFSVILLVIVLVHIIVALIVKNILLYTNITMITLSCISLLIIVMIVFIIKSSIKVNNEISNLFFNKCDPLKALEIVNDKIEDSLTKSTTFSLFTTKIMILFRLKYFEEAKELLKIIPETYTSNPTKLIIWEHNKVMINTAINEGDIELLQNKFKNLSLRYPKKQTVIDMYSESQVTYYYFVNYKYEGLHKFYENELQFAFSLLEKVSYNANLARIYYNTGNKEKAKELAKFVVDNGNTLAVVEDCKKILEQLGD